MEQRRLGQSGVHVSVLGLGTWPMGGAWWGGTDDDESERTIHRAVELGVTLFDTAEGYGDGHAEEVLGRALAGRREEVVIADKVATGSFRTAADRSRVRSVVPTTPDRLRRCLLSALAKHRRPYRRGDGDPGEAACRRRIRAIGVSNFTADEMRAAGEHGRIDVLQPPYNLFWRFIESDQVPYCREHGIGIMTYSSLAQGLLTGTLTPTTTFAEGDSRPSTILFQPGIYERCLQAVELLRPVAENASVTLPRLALGWLFGRLGVSTALVGARTVREIEETGDGAPWPISPADVAEADRIANDIFETLPRVPDMFQTWTRSDLQRRRYERSGLMPSEAPAG